MARVDYRGSFADAQQHNDREILIAVALVLLDEVNRRRVFDAAIAEDLVREINVLRDLHGLALLTIGDLTAQVPSQITVDQLVEAVKLQLKLIS